MLAVAQVNYIRHEVNQEYGTGGSSLCLSSRVSVAVFFREREQQSGKNWMAILNNLPVKILEEHRPKSLYRFHPRLLSGIIFTQSAFFISIIGEIDCNVLTK